MPRRARIPEQRMPVFPGRSLLEKELAGPVKNEHVNGPMPQVIPMHFTAARGAYGMIVFVYDLEVLCRALAADRFRFGTGPIRERDPLFQTEFFGARPRVEPNRRRRFIPIRNFIAEQIAKLFRALRESLANEPKKCLGIVRRQLVGWARRD